VCRVKEKTPATGMEPIDWVLFTSEPIETAEILAFARVVEAKVFLEVSAACSGAPPRVRDAVVHERFNLHASVHLPAHDDLGREWLCRYLARPAFSLARFGVRRDGLIVYRVKKAGRGRAKQRVMTPLECLGRLAAMVPPPRYPLLRLHGVLGRGMDEARRDAATFAEQGVPRRTFSPSRTGSRILGGELYAPLSRVDWATPRSRHRPGLHRQGAPRAPAPTRSARRSLTAQRPRARHVAPRPRCARWTPSRPRVPSLLGIHRPP